jgi:hypothetical protein
MRRGAESARMRSPRLLGNVRRRDEKFNTSGVIVLFEGNVQSWVNTLRNPEHWQPGCVAIDEGGGSWTAIAGNQGDGALMWLPDRPI